MKTIRELIDAVVPPRIEVVAIDFADGVTFARLDEGKWVDGRYARNIRIDRDTHFDTADDDAMHAHVYGRKDRDDALVIVRRNGSSSHGRKGELHAADADALRARGFVIGDDNLVEWVEIPHARRLVLSEAFAG